jgi:hypothetical protein
MANAQMKASLVLNFKDELGAGLTKMEQQLDKLKKLGEQLTLGELGTGAESIQKTISATRDLAGDVRSVGAAAKGATAELRQMGAAYSHVMTQRSFSRNDARMLWGAGARPPGYANLMTERRFTANDAAMVWGGPRGAPARAAERGGGMGGMAGGLAAIGGGYAALASVRSYASFEDLARTAAIASGVSGPLAVGAESKRLQALFNHDALATAQSGVSIGTAYSEMVGQGLAPSRAEGLLGVHSRVAEAYGIDSATLTPATVALSKNLGISEADMGGALAAMATANYKGRFKIADFALQLPSITGDMVTFGMKGRGAADEVFAALETVMQSSSSPGQGAANFKDFMDYLASPHAARSFDLKSRGMLSGPTRAILDKYHVTGFDMPKVLEQARMKGVDPITAALDALQAKIKDLPPDVIKDVLGAFFTNSMSRDAAQSLLLFRQQYEALRTDLHAVGENTLDKALEDRLAGAAAQTKLLDEEMAQLERRLGAGLMPVVRKTVFALDDVNSVMQWMDGKFPGLGDDVVSTTAAVLDGAAAFGALGLVVPKLAKGLMLFLTPIGRVTAALVGMETGAFGASSVLGIGLPASLGVATSAMNTFTAAANRNPFVKAGFLLGSIGEDLYNRMNQKGLDTTSMSPEQVTRMTGMLGAGDAAHPSPRAGQEWIEHHGPGLGVTPEGWAPPVPIPPPVTGNIYVWVDPNGVPIITHLDSTGGVTLVHPAGPGPDPGQTLGRP